MEIGAGKPLFNSFIGPTSGSSYEPKAASTNGSGGPSFMDALRDTFARETGKLTAINLPGDQGQVFSSNSSILSTHSTVV